MPNNVLRPYGDPIRSLSDIIKYHDNRISQDIPSRGFYELLFGYGQDKNTAENLTRNRYNYNVDDINNMNTEQKKQYLNQLQNSTLADSEWAQYGFKENPIYKDTGDNIPAYYSKQDNKSVIREQLLNQPSGYMLNAKLHEDIHGSQNRNNNKILSFGGQDSRENFSKKYYDVVAQNTPQLNDGNYSNMGEYLSRAGEIEARILSAAEMAKKFPNAPTAMYSGYPSDVILGQDVIRSIIENAGYNSNISQGVWDSINELSLVDGNREGTQAGIDAKFEDYYDKYYNDLNNEYQRVLENKGSISRNASIYDLIVNSEMKQNDKNNNSFIKRILGIE